MCKMPNSNKRLEWPTWTFLQITLHIFYDEKDVLNFFDYFQIKKNIFILLYNGKFLNGWVAWVVEPPHGLSEIQ